PSVQPSPAGPVELRGDIRHKPQRAPFVLRRSAQFSPLPASPLSFVALSATNLNDPRSGARSRPALPPGARPRGPAPDRAARRPTARRPTARPAPDRAARERRPAPWGVHRLRAVALRTDAVGKSWEPVEFEVEAERIAQYADVV